MWRIIRERDSARLVIELAMPLSQEDKTSVSEEGARLLDFVAADAQDRDIEFVLRE
jgi:hypothetical protein